MWVDKLQISNIRSFERLNLNFSKYINIFIGENNSGKSTILKCLYELQSRNALNSLDLRQGSKEGYIRRFLTNEDDSPNNRGRALLSYKPSDCL